MQEFLWSTLIPHLFFKPVLKWMEMTKALTLMLQKHSYQGTCFAHFGIYFLV